MQPLGTQHRFGPRPALILFGLVNLLLFLPALGSGGMLFGFDTVNEWFYFRQWGFDILKSGRIPLWNPYYFSGYPFAADPQMGLFYPLHFLYMLLPVERAVNWTVWLHFTLGGYFTYLLARELGISGLGSAAAGLAFNLSGFMMGNVLMGFLPQISTLVWTPLFLVFAHRGAVRGEFKQFAYAGLAFAMQLLAGHYQFAYFTGLLGAALVAGAWLRGRSAGGGLGGLVRPALGLGLAAALGFMIAGVQTVPFMELMARIDRGGGFDPAEAAIASFPPENLYTLVVPFLKGDEVDSIYQGRSILSMANLYMGIVPLFFMAAALLRARSRRPRLVLFLALIAVAAFALALGGYNPLYPVLHRVVPGLQFLRYPARWIFLAVIALALLAGIGFQWFEERTGAGRYRAAAALLLIILAADGVWVARRSVVVFDTSGLRFTAEQKAALRESTHDGLYRLSMLEPAEAVPFPRMLGPNLHRINRYSQSYFHRGMLDRIPVIEGEGCCVLERYGRLMTNGRRFTVFAADDPRVLALAGVETRVAYERCDPAAPRECETVVKTVDPLPRAFIVREHAVMADPELALGAVRSDVVDLGRIVLLESEPGPAWGEPGAAAEDSVRRLEQDLASSRWRVTLAGRGGFLVLTEVFYPGWEVFVDGVEAELLRADYAFRAVRLQPGEHTVEFRYRPAALRLGWLLTGLGLAVFGALTLGDLARPPRIRTPSGRPAPA